MKPYHGTSKEFLESIEEDGVDAPESDAKRAYITGVGWCWMSDGEIIEVINQEGLDI